MATIAPPVDIEFVSDTPAGHGSQNTRLIVNGQDITTMTRGFELRSAVGELVTAKIELITRKGFSLNMPAHAEMHVTACPGYVLIEEATETGKRWRVEREAE